MAIYMQYKMQKASGKIYGASWDGSSSTRWTRTDDAALLADPNPAVNNGTGSSPFDNIKPWAGMVRVTDAEAGELVAIPKFYFKLDYANQTTPRGLKIQISMVKHDGFMCSPAHMDRGDGVGEREIVYIGRYHCASGTTDKYKSKTGVTPQTSETRATFRSGIHNLGTKIWQLDYATLLTIQMLYLVEFADWNSQTKIGYGCGNNSSLENCGSTDAMQYHTGTNKASRTAYGHTQYRYIEDLWGNVLDWCDGIYFKGTDGANIYVIKNPSDFSDATGGTYVGNRGISSGYISSYNISSTNGFSWFMFPYGRNGSSSTYVCDEYNYSDVGVSLRFGGAYTQGQSRGLFRSDTDNPDSYTSGGGGSRLMKLP